MKWMVYVMASLMLISPALARGFVLTPDHFNDTIKHNETFSDHFRVIPETDVNTTVQNFTISWVSPFNVILSDTSFAISTYKDIDFNITVPEGFLKGIYRSYLFVHMENETRFVTIRLEIPGEVKCSLPEKIEVTTRAGETGIFYMEAENTGNEMVTVTFNTSSGIGDLHSITESAKLYPNVPFEIPFTYSIDQDTKPDTYKAIIFVRHGSVSNEVEVHFTVFDGTPPTIEDAGLVGEEYDEREAGFDREFWAECSDNVGVKKVEVAVTSEDFNDTFGMALDEGRWRTKFDLEFTGRTKFKVICEDKHGNIQNLTIEREIIPVQGCEVGSVEFYSVKRDTVISKKILDCTRKIPVKVTLRDFDYDPSTDANTTGFELWLDTGTDKKDFRNETLELEDVDLLKLGLSANGSGFYTGEIRLDFPKWVHEDVTLDFSGRVGDMTIPETYSGYVGDGLLKCRANLTEDERTSTWVCDVNYPITTPLDLLSKPMTPSRYQEIEGVCGREKTVLQNTLNQSRVEAGIYATVVTFFIIYIIISYIIPNISHNRRRPKVLFKLK